MLDDNVQPAVSQYNTARGQSHLQTLRIFLTLILLSIIALVLSGFTTPHLQPQNENTSNGLNTNALGKKRPVIVFMTSGLRWQDIDLSNPSYSALRDLADRSMLANNVARGLADVTCPADGWLSLSAGQRHVDAQARHDQRCRKLEEPHEVANKVLNPEENRLVAVPHWQDYTAKLSFNRPAAGILGQTLIDNNVNALAIGPGAAIALADTNGIVRSYHQLPEDSARYQQLLPMAVDKFNVVIVDLGSVTAPENITFNSANSSYNPKTVQGRTVRVQGILEKLNTAISIVDDQADIIVASIADDSTTAYLQSAIIEPDIEIPGTLTYSESTHQKGIIQTSDISAQILAQLAPASTASEITTPITPATDTIIDLDVRYDALLSRAYQADATRNAYIPFLLFVTVITVTSFLLFVAMALTPASRWFEQHPRLQKALGNFMLWSGSIPFAAYLAVYIPTWLLWPESPELTTLTTFMTVILLGVLVVALARGFDSLLKKQRGALTNPLGAAFFIAAGFYFVQLVTVYFGKVGQIDGLLGAQTIRGMRFYGIGNEQFTFLMISTFVTATVLLYVFGGRPQAGIYAFVAVGVLGVIADGFPTLGADFGGPPAFIPAMFLLGTLLIGSKRITWKKVTAAIAVTLVSVATFGLTTMMLLSMQSSHVSKFYRMLLRGNANEVIMRKAELALNSAAGSWVNLIGLIAGLAALIVALLWAKKLFKSPVKSWVEPAARAGQQLWLLKPLTIAVVVGSLLGMLVNDSGILILAAAAIYALPLFTGAFTLQMASNAAGETRQKVTGKRVRSAADHGVESAETDQTL